MDSLAPRSDLYHFLAEALSEPPDWLALSGREWPLFKAALHLAVGSEAARKAVVAMMDIDEEPIEVRRERCASLFSGQGRPPVWVYESGALSGRLATEVTWDVEHWYRQAGIEITGGELPDHASLELEFLAYLNSVEQFDFGPIERGFLRSHAGRWLPNLGRVLQLSGDAVYAPVGQLLQEWMAEADPPMTCPSKVLEKSSPIARRIPTILFEHQEVCTLCGFCVQKCPVNALRILEDHQTTRLQLLPQKCIGCGMCMRVCDPRVLELEKKVPADNETLPGWVSLRESDRVACRVCGSPMVSQAEYQFVAERLGNPGWLQLCADCRPGYLGRE